MNCMMRPPFWVNEHRVGTVLFQDRFVVLGKWLRQNLTQPIAKEWEHLGEIDMRGRSAGLVGLCKSP